MFLYHSSAEEVVASKQTLKSVSKMVSVLLFALVLWEVLAVSNLSGTSSHAASDETAVDATLGDTCIYHA